MKHPKAKRDWEIRQTDKPRHHLHVCSELHFATGPVEFEDVLNVIAELFKRQAEGHEVL